MTSFEQFREELSELLRHLHDPDCRPSDLMYGVLGCDPLSGVSGVQSEVIRAIEGLERSPTSSPTARSHRDSEVLRGRYLLRFTQEEAAERSNMSVRSMRRAQREATHMLARLLWEQHIARAASQEELASQRHSGAEGESAPDWRQQVRQELVSLQAGAPSSIADVGQAIAYAIELESRLIAGHGITLAVGRGPTDLTAAVHPAALRQVLIVAIAQLSRCVHSGPLTIEAGSEGLSPRRIRITLRGRADSRSPLPDDGMIAEILAFVGGTIESVVERGHVTLCISIPSADEVVVLVVDDNPDMVHFYQRCTAGSCYHVVHADHGQRTIEAIVAARPDVIVLDIILPDADGWQLLAQLRQHPATKSVPVILCSIVREEELAQALGAAIYLPKPVRYREFMGALDEAVSLVRAAERTS